MAYLTLIFLLYLNQFFPKDLQHVSLSKVYVDNKIGFIDSTGRIIIEPTFYNALEFSEGLAAARSTGKFGYINKEGIYEIEPKYDYAESFNNGTAVIYIGETPGILHLDKSEILFNNYKSISFFSNNLAFVKTKTEKMGVINNEGKLIVDTVYKYINEFSDGLAVVQGFDTKIFENTIEGEQERGEWGVIDTNGRVIVPFGKYWRIKNFERGCFDVSWYSDDFRKYYVGFLNRNGEIVIYKDNDLFGETLDDNINDSTFVMSYFDSKEANGIKSSEFCYKGIVNSKGKIIAVDKEWESIWPVNEEFSIVRKKVSFDQVLIKSDGEIIFENKYDSYKNVSNRSMIIVYNNFKSGVIDAYGKVIVSLQDELISPNNLGKEFFVFTEYDKKRDYYKLGLADFESKIIIPPGDYESISPFLNNGLIQVFKNDTLIYFDRRGKKVWESACFSENSYLNIDYMRIGYFYAGDGYKAISLKNKFPDNNVTLSIDENDTISYAKYYKGLNLYLSNSTDDSIKFDSQDNRLYIKLQAKNDNGDWKDIDYILNSFCGNSYYKFKLEKKSFLTFSIPIFEGDFKTLMRAKLSYTLPNDNKNIIDIFSNEVECSINEAQFWRHREYFSSGIMDPYSD